jgi:exopolyphosphatase/guanosine-5'-triphosphate,3'-diphosphate pyrophosphatase
MIDIGGGSVEFIVGDGARAAMLESRKLGAARMTSQFVQSDPVSKDDLESLRRYYDTELAPLYKQLKQLRPSFAIGTSGTLENIAAMCAEFSDGGQQLPAVIERTTFFRLLQQLLKSDSRARGRIKGLDEQRKDQIVAGAVLVGHLFENLNLKKITLCSSALREGIMLDYLSRHVPDLQIRRDVRDPRRRAVLDLARRCDWHQNHSEHVTSLCLKLFDELKPLHGMGSVERELIEFGSLLHDIGWHISGKGHHKHSMYLIQHGKLAPFSTDEIQVMANIARYHRKGIPEKAHEAYAELTPRTRKIVDVGAALLRVADGLDRTHASVVQNLKCRIGEKKIQVILDTRADAQLEIWGAKRKSDWFAQVFRKKLDCDLKK